MQIKHLLNKSGTAHNRISKQLNVTCNMPKTIVLAKIVSSEVATAENRFHASELKPTNEVQI